MDGIIYHKSPSRLCIYLAESLRQVHLRYILRTHIETTAELAANYLFDSTFNHLATTTFSKTVKLVLFVQAGGKQDN